MWDHPSLAQLVSTCKLLPVYFDQCRTGAKWRKTTQLLASPSIHPHIFELFAPLIHDSAVCGGDYPSLASGRQADESYISSQASAYSSHMNELLAQSFLRAAGTKKLLSCVVHPLDAWADFYDASYQMDETDAAAVLPLATDSPMAPPHVVHCMAGGRSG